MSRNRRSSPTAAAAGPSSRLWFIDAFRGLAILLMIVYHGAWDLESFGLAPPGMMSDPGWVWFGTFILGSFLVVSGFGLFWGWRDGVKPRKFVRRQVILIAAAIAITISTYLVQPGGFVYFGVLHHIAVGSLFLLLLRKAGVIWLAVLAVSMVVLPSRVEHDILDEPIVWWLGLSRTVRFSNDFVPMMPWFSLMLAGAVLSRFAAGREEWFSRLGGSGTPGWARPLGWAGRHSLVIYLLHQPVLWGSLTLWFWLFPG